MTPTQARRFVDQLVPGTRTTGEPVALAGGLINNVWRVPAAPRSVIVKYAPPYAAAAPDIALDPARIGFEARALELLGGRLSSVRREDACPPRLLAYAGARHALVMEDIGVGEDLGELLAEGRGGEDAGLATGAFIGRLHAATFCDAELARAHDNAAVQATREAVQYRAVGPVCREVGLAGASAIDRCARDLGKRLRQPGRCLIMGDLWPRSVLRVSAGWRILDWEFSHFGSPAQDLGHFAAHLWMHAHRAAGDAQRGAAEACLDAVMEGYRKGVGDCLDELLDDKMRKDCAVHMGCEILVRTVGAFQRGYLYEGLERQHPTLCEAVRHGAALVIGAAAGPFGE